MATKTKKKELWMICFYNEPQTHPPSGLKLMALFPNDPGMPEPTKQVSVYLIGDYFEVMNSTESEFTLRFGTTSFAVALRHSALLALEGKGESLFLSVNYDTQPSHVGQQTMTITPSVNSEKCRFAERIVMQLALPVKKNVRRI